MRIVHSRTWLILPGAEAMSSPEIVWIESMITSSGSWTLMLSMIASRSVSGRTRIFSPSTPSLTARSFS